jgi:protein N-terminal amidase
MNWLMSEPSSDAEDGATGGLAQANDSWDSVKQTLSYFALRVSPLIGSNVIFVACNRAGVERGTAFTGSSCVMQLGVRPIVLDYADQREEKVIISPVTLPMRNV